MEPPLAPNVPNGTWTRLWYASLNTDATPFIDLVDLPGEGGPTVTLARLAAVLLLLVALAAVGCSGGDDDDGGDAQQQQAPAETSGDGGGAAAGAVSMAEFKFDPAEVTVERGSTLTVRNEGSLEHDLKVRDGGEVIGGTDVFPAGESQALQVDFPPGSYEMFCSVPGHEDSGMKGSFTVE
jgi:plastocyanin